MEGLVQIPSNLTKMYNECHPGLLVWIPGIPLWKGLLRAPPKNPGAKTGPRFYSAGFESSFYWRLSRPSVLRLMKIQGGLSPPPMPPQCQRLSWRKWPAKMKGLRVSISHQHLSGKWSQVLRHLIWYSALKNLKMLPFVNFHDKTSVSNNLHSFFGHFWLVYHGKWYWNHHLGEYLWATFFYPRRKSQGLFFCLWGDLVEKVVATQILFTPNPVEMIPFDGSRLFPNGLVETT